MLEQVLSIFGAVFIVLIMIFILWHLWCEYFSLNENKTRIIYEIKMIGQDLQHIKYRLKILESGIEDSEKPQQKKEKK